jgi:shikimate kinase
MSTIVRGRGLALVGYRGTGKTTVGRLVAGSLGLPFVDADAALEARLARTIRAIFEESGEAHFRDAEEETLRDLTSGPACVLATGGGVILRETNRAALRGFGRVVWLTAEPAVLAARLGADPKETEARPPLTSAGTTAEIAEVLAQRAALYREVADLEIPTDGRSPFQVAEDLLARLDATQ